jgi:hypothetical protein
MYLQDPREFLQDLLQLRGAGLTLEEGELRGMEDHHTVVIGDEQDLGSLHELTEYNRTLDPDWIGFHPLASTFLFLPKHEFIDIRIEGIQEHKYIISDSSLRKLHRIFPP